VEFRDPSKASKVLAQQREDGIALGERELDVRWSDRKALGAVRGSKLFVGALPSSVKEEDLLQELGKIAPVSSVSIGERDPICFSQ
jgi:RNA recognition motif-containing protein